MRDEASVDRYLRRLRRRAWLIHGLRASVLAVGSGALAFAVAATIVGAVGSPTGSMVTALVVMVVAGAAAAWGLRPVSRWRGSRAADLLAAERPDLVSAARSAMELAQDPSMHDTAPDLVRAHRERVQATLVQIPVAHVVRWRQLRHPTLLMGGLALALGLAWMVGVDRAASGAYALLHPDARTDEGLSVAAIVGGTRARLVFPSHVGRSPQVLGDADRIEAPRGTVVHYRVRPRIDAKAAAVDVAGRRARLTAQPDGTFEGQFVIRDGGPLRIRMQDADDGWLEDSAIRRVHAVEDQAPTVSMTRPETDVVVELDETVPLAWEASDDVGLRAVDLVVRTPDGQDHRRRLLREKQNRDRSRARGRTHLVAIELDARPGDTLTVWLEAQDGDLVSGPNVGTSVKRSLTVASESTRRQRALAEMKGTLDVGLAALADRLERPPPEDTPAARARFQVVQHSGMAFTEALSHLADLTAEAWGGPLGDASLYRTMSTRQRRGLNMEKRAHARRVAPHSRRTRLDERLVEQLEDDLLLLADTLGKARLQDAADIARELESLRREMASLVAELRRADSQEARRALRAAITRAQARMRELMARLSRMGEDVPSDFVNAEALRQGETQDALQAMSEALERGDLSGMERQLQELEHQIHSLAEALGSAESSYAQDRFGPREKAMAEAMDTLAGLEAEQRELLRRSDTLRRNAAERALRAAGALDADEAKRLADHGRTTRDALSNVPEQSLGPLEQEALLRARQRLEDSADALLAQDLGEARRMARKAVRDLEDLARDLELSALMFPGRDGRMGETARKVREASKQARSLRDEIDQSLPRLRDHLRGAGKRQMRDDAQRQTEAMDAAGALAERFGSGPDGRPLSPDAADSLREIQRAMERAKGELQSRDPVGTTQAQEQAARRLSKLRKDLEQGQRSSASGGGGGGGRGDASGQTDFRNRVQIPGADAHEGPIDLRRRLLDAMREDTAEGYGDAVRRYYEELLR